MAKTVRRLFIPDTHTPFHDQRAFDLMLDVASDFKPNEVVYLGDFFDCYSVSDYSKDPRQNFKFLSQEIEPGIGLMAEVEKRSRASAYMFLEGNHENRIKRYLDTFAPVLGDIGSPRELLKIPKNYRYLPYGQTNYYRMPGLVATHGTVTTKHSTASMVEKLGCSVIHGHTHRMQSTVIKKLDGIEHRGYSCGWLGDCLKAAEYVKDVPNYTLGFALGTWVAKNFWVELVHIVDYSCVAYGSYYGRT
jgi:predicted phosphodiesterase